MSSNKLEQRSFRKLKNLFPALGLFAAVLFYCNPSLADVQITGFSNLDFGSWSGTGDLTLTDDLCVHNTNDVNYTITASGPGGAFNLSNGGHNIAFQVRFRKSGGAFQTLSHGIPSSTFDGADTSSATCAGTGGVNATLEIKVLEAALSAAASGSYSGTLTVVLEPA